jgi:hypothetical protein
VIAGASVVTLLAKVFAGMARLEGDNVKKSSALLVPTMRFAYK